MRRLIFGPRAVTAAVRAHASEVAVVYVAEAARKELRELADLCTRNKVVVEERSVAELDGLAKSERHQGVIAIGGSYGYISLEELIERLPEGPSLVVALDEVTDPHNFGAIVRSAVAFGASGVVTLKQRAAPVTPVVVRASAGATEHARIARVTNLVSALDQFRERDFDVVGLAVEGAQDLPLYQRRGRSTVLVVGSEGRGLRRLVREHCTDLVRIPMHGPIESLNASVAAAVALYALTTPSDVP
jgi:23S rRNA (guanosine2251-2'-O)-methyltransferase